ncbi:unnamed protein product [Acanthocheilonema viteae]|uniref:Uncharacterized protein n=1 Tax=Acanthocheilonema viteae TaxID=6277 RepID=A0A498S1U0_ACAVI|nr:unnamed protein product [Acanthocheilonema viteae]
MDTTFSDIIYFINAKSIGSQWDIRQFRINEHGNLIAMEKFVVYHSQQGQLFRREMVKIEIITAGGKLKSLPGNHGRTEQFNQFIVELDLKRSILYTFNRLKRNLLSECLFDLLFRPSHLLQKWSKFNEARHTQAWLESFAVDGQLMMFTESIRNKMGATSELYLTNLRIRNSSIRLLHLNFVTDIGVLRKQTYAHLSTRNIPTFDDMRQLYIQNVRNTPLTMSHASTKHTVLNIVSLTTLTLTVETTSTSTVTSAWRTTTINGIDRFYSEIENDRSSGIDDEIRKETETQKTACPTTLLAQYVTHQEQFAENISGDNDIKESEKQLVGNMEKTRDTTFLNNTGDKFWKTNTSEVFDTNDHIYGNEMGNKQETKDSFQLSQQVNSEKTVTSATAGHSETTSPPTLRLKWDNRLKKKILHGAQDFGYSDEEEEERKGRAIKGNGKRCDAVQHFETVIS